MPLPLVLQLLGFDDSWGDSVLDIIIIIFIIIRVNDWEEEKEWAKTKQKTTTKAKTRHDVT